MPMTDNDQVTIRIIEHRLAGGSHVYDVAVGQDRDHLTLFIKATSPRDAEAFVAGLETLLLRRTLNTVKIMEYESHA